MSLDFVLPPPRQAALPVAGGGLFPIRRIFCVGQNYAEHAREMGSDPMRQAPFFFCKPADAVVTGGAAVSYPAATRSLHHEIELVVALGSGGMNLNAATALGHVWGYAAGIDLTRRDMQAEAKKAGRPWDMSKGFDHSAPVGVLRSTTEIGHPERGGIALDVDGAPRQRGDLDQMIWRVPEIIAVLSRLVRLAPGDLIFTGTPAGVAAVEAGQTLSGRIEGVGEVTTAIE